MAKKIVSSVASGSTHEKGILNEIKDLKDQKVTYATKTKLTGVANGKAFMESMNNITDKYYEVLDRDAKNLMNIVTGMDILDQKNKKNFGG